MNGQNNSAYVFLQVAVTGGWEAASALHDALHAVAGVKRVHFLMGPTDVIVYVEAMDNDGLLQAIGDIRAVNGVQSTDTRMIVPM